MWMKSILLALVLIFVSSPIMAIDKDDLRDNLRSNREKGRFFEYTDYENVGGKEESILIKTDINAVIMPDFIGKNHILFPDGNKEVYVSGAGLGVVVLADKGNVVFTIAWDDPDTWVRFKGYSLKIYIPSGGKVREYELADKGIWSAAGLSWQPLNSVINQQVWNRISRVSKVQLPQNVMHGVMTYEKWNSINLTESYYDQNYTDVATSLLNLEFVFKNESLTNKESGVRAQIGNIYGYLSGIQTRIANYSQWAQAAKKVMDEQLDKKSRNVINSELNTIINLQIKESNSNNIDQLLTSLVLLARRTDMQTQDKLTQFYAVVKQINAYTQPRYQALAQMRGQMVKIRENLVIQIAQTKDEKQREQLNKIYTSAGVVMREAMKPELAGF